MTFTLYDDNYPTHDGMRIVLSGLLLSNFIQNPIMLYMHHRGGTQPTGSEVIGKWENIRIEGKRLLADARFDDKEPLAQKIASKVQQGFLSAASIGILVKQTSTDEADKMADQRGVSITDSVLLEASIVDIPRCAGALASATTDSEADSKAKNKPEKAPAIINHCLIYSTCTMHPTLSSAADTASTETAVADTAVADTAVVATPDHPTEQLVEATEAVTDATPIERPGQQRVKDALAKTAISQEESRYYLSLYQKDALLAEQLLQCQLRKAHVGRGGWRDTLDTLSASTYRAMSSPMGTSSPCLSPDGAMLRDWRARNPEALAAYFAELATKQALVNKYEQE